MMVFITPMLCWLVGACWLLTWLVEDITNALSQLNPTKMSNQRNRELNGRFFKIAHLYSNVKQLSETKCFEAFL